jgi:GNAT superfamily N-acetyltransferase
VKPAKPRLQVDVRNTRPEDFPEIIALCQRVYPESPPWTEETLASHHAVFPEGQLVAVDSASGGIVGMAASLVIRWDDYAIDASWREFTAQGRFTNHDPSGRTLYGAEVMVDPSHARQGIGRKLYAGRRDIVKKLGLLRIRAGARLRGYGQVADRMTPEQYVHAVVEGTLAGPTLSFQLSEGFEVIAVVSGYLRHDPESLGYAAVVEWLNPEVAKAADYADRDQRFVRRPPQ